jgi:hypothetical protein
MSLHFIKKLLGQNEIDMDHIFSNCYRKMHVLKLVTNSKKCKYNAIDIKQNRKIIDTMIDQLIVMKG